jgi:hypothetical protein
MSMRTDFQRRARESVQFAQWAGTPHDRDLFLEMARAWRGLADVSEDEQGVVAQREAIPVDRAEAVQSSFS